MCCFYFLFHFLVIKLEDFFLETCVGGLLGLLFLGNRSCVCVYCFVHN